MPQGGRIKIVRVPSRRDVAEAWIEMKPITLNAIRWGSADFLVVGLSDSEDSILATLQCVRDGLDCRVSQQVLFRIFPENAAGELGRPQWIADVAKKRVS